MNFAERLQMLRKAQGLSQEELAEQLGVSRQSVSKYESGQSTPDIEKIILLSEFFGVTTDYLLKGAEYGQDTKGIPAQERGRVQFREPKENERIFAIVSTALNAIGLVLAVLIWKERETMGALAAGFVFMILGCMIYAVGMMGEKSEEKEKAKRLFWRINIWILSFIPMSMVHNILSGSWPKAPYPILANSLLRFGIFWMAYIGLGLLVMWKMRETRKSEEVSKQT